MKVIHLIDGLQLGGKERQLIELLKGLTARQEMELQLVMLSDVVCYPYVRNLNLKIHFIPRKIKKDPRAFAKIYQICKEFQPDIIHSWESMCSIYAIPSAKLLNIKLINGMIRNTPQTMKVWDKAWIRAMLTFPFSDVVLANSHAGLKSYGAPKQKSHCIHNGFDFSRLGQVRGEEVIREQFEISAPNIVGMVARFAGGKDYQTFLLAAMRVLQQRSDVVFLAVGDGQTLQRCKEIVKPAFHNKIKFLGVQSDIESIINVFNVGVLADHTPGISNAIMEYMALAKPVVATDCGGTREIVIDDKTGFLVEPQSAESMTQKIEFLLDRPDVARKMGSAGRTRLLEEFDLDKMTNKYVELYRQCVGI
jgi:glycosyltransferase involved in cell wall biosynthesis